MWTSGPQVARSTNDSHPVASSEEQRHVHVLRNQPKTAESHHENPDSNGQTSRTAQHRATLTSDAIKMQIHSLLGSDKPSLTPIHEPGTGAARAAEPVGGPGRVEVRRPPRGDDGRRGSVRGGDSSQEQARPSTHSSAFQPNNNRNSAPRRHTFLKKEAQPAPTTTHATMASYAEAVARNRPSNVLLEGLSSGTLAEVNEGLGGGIPVAEPKPTGSVDPPINPGVSQSSKPPGKSQPRGQPLRPDYVPPHLRLTATKDTVSPGPTQVSAIPSSTGGVAIPSTPTPKSTVPTSGGIIRGTGGKASPSPQVENKSPQVDSSSPIGPPMYTILKKLVAGTPGEVSKQGAHHTAKGKDIAGSTSHHAAASSSGPSRNSSESATSQAYRTPFRGWAGYDAAPPLPAVPCPYIPEGGSPQQDPHATPRELVMWDGQMVPPPIEWEGRNPWHDNKFDRNMLAWLDNIENIDGHLEMRSPIFTEGHGVADGLALVQAPVHSPTKPSEGVRHINQYRTSHEMIMQKRIARLNRKVAAKDYQERMQRENLLWSAQLAAAREHNEPNPNAPTIDIYLRPGRISDVRRCAEIYRHYARESVVVPEDSGYREQEMRSLFEDVRTTHLPWIVAVKGRPGKNETDLRGSSSLVIGYAFADDFGTPFGPYQHTVEMQIFTHPDHLRHGVGKSLMDRLLYYLDPGHMGRSGYTWLPMGLDWGCGGKRVISKVLCNVPHPNKDTEEIEWLRKWFVDEWDFVQAGCLIEVGTKKGTWVNILQLQKTTTSTIAL